MDVHSSQRNNTGITKLTKKNNTHVQSTNTLSRTRQGQRLEELLAYSEIIKKIKLESKAKKIQIEKNQFSSTTSIDGCRNHCTAENIYLNNYCESANVKPMAYKKLLKSLPRCDDNDTHHSFEPSHTPSSSKYIQKSIVDQKATYLNVENKSEPSIDESKAMALEAECAEKTTYCRPVINIYSQAFVQKTIERNAKLQLLVKKLVLAREKEKQNEAWNNYINELKNKHRYYDSQPYRSPKMLTAEDEIPNTIDDCFNNRYSCKQSDLYDHLLGDIYDGSTVIGPEQSFDRASGYESSTNRPYKYKHNSFCFPTSSQGRLMMLKRERQKQFGGHLKYRPTENFYRGTAIMVDENYKPSTRNKSKTITPNKLSVEKTTSMQNKSDFVDCHGLEEDCLCNTEQNMTDEFKEVSENVERIKQSIKQAHNDDKQQSLANIENKLDTLIESLNAFLDELKTKKTSNVKSTGASCCDFGQINKARSDPFGCNKSRVVLCGIAHQKPGNTLAFSSCPSKRQDTIDEILNEEINKSKEAKRDIIEHFLNSDQMTNDPQCSVQITIDIPTKEDSTEVTDSFYTTAQQEMIVEEIGADNSGRMTIAVNTDPLGLLALFRISTDTMKQILSYMPNMDYTSYLSRLQIRSAPPPSVVSRYVCNICGSSFSRPSQLSDHIQEHKLGNPRNCCVCRHVLDSRSRRGLFHCQHCGQVFTRAYCRELHQQTCSKRSGKSHDVRSSLTLLT